MIFLIFGASESTLNPPTDADPDVFGSRVVSILMVVLFPAPFGPRKPKNSPSLTLNVIPFTAFVPSPYVLTSWDTSIIPGIYQLWRAINGPDINYIVSDTEPDSALLLAPRLGMAMKNCN